MIFYERKEDSIVSSLETALTTEKLEVGAAKARAEKMTSAINKTAGLKGRNILVGLLILGALLAAGLLFTNEKVAETLLDCFKVMFAAFIGVLGFETSKKDG